MPIRMTGMVSGLDTDSIVKELVSAYSTKKEKYEKERTKHSRSKRKSGIRITEEPNAA